MTLYLNIKSYYMTIKNEISMENDCELLPIMLNRKTDRKRNSFIFLYIYHVIILYYARAAITAYHFTSFSPQGLRDNVNRHLMNGIKQVQKAGGGAAVVSMVVFAILGIAGSTLRSSSLSDEALNRGPMTISRTNCRLVTHGLRR